MSASGPYLNVRHYEVRHEPGRDIVMAVFLHHGQVFNLYFEAGDALALAGELERAYQESAAHDPLVQRTAPCPPPKDQGGTPRAHETPPTP